jgi:hypothetical protein
MTATLRYYIESLDGTTKQNAPMPAVSFRSKMYDGASRLAVASTTRRVPMIFHAESRRPGLLSES